MNQGTLHRKPQLRMNVQKGYVNIAHITTQKDTPSETLVKRIVGKRRSLATNCPTILAALMDKGEKG